MESSNFKDLFKTFNYDFIRIFFSKISLLLVHVFAIIFLTTNEYGNFSYLMTFIFFFYFFISFGMTTFHYKTLIDLSKKQKISFMNETLSYSLIASFISILLFVFLYIFLSLPIFFLFLPIILLIIPIHTFLLVYHITNNKFKFLGKLYFYVAIVLIFVSYVLISNYLIYGAIISYIFYHLVAILSFLFYDKLYTKLKLTFKFKKLFRNWRKGLKYGFFALIGLVYLQLDLFLLGQFNFFEQIAYYSIILKIIEFSIIPIFSFATVFYPKIIEHKNSGDKKSTFRNFLALNLITFFYGVFILFLTYGFLFVLTKYILLKYNFDIFINNFLLILLSIPFVLNLVLNYKIYILAKDKLFHFIFLFFIFLLVSLLLKLFFIIYLTNLSYIFLITFLTLMIESILIFIVLFFNLRK